jgi:hypothetical protein
VHGLKLKLGLYTDLSNKTVGFTCGTGPGSYGHYDSDMQTMTGFGMDFLKVDYCAYDQKDTARFHPTIHDQLASWQQLRDAINKTNRPVCMLSLTFLRSMLENILEDALCFLKVWSARCLNWSIVTRAHAPRQVYSYFCPRSFSGGPLPPYVSLKRILHQQDTELKFWNHMTLCDPILLAPLPGSLDPPNASSGTCSNNGRCITVR